MDDEIWAFVPEYNEKYQVSNFGRVKSIGGFGCGRWNTDKLRVLSSDRKGYLRVSLCLRGKVKLWTVHSLVLLSFVGPRPVGYDVCHANGIVTDNRLENLRYDTRKANIHDKKAHGTQNHGSTHPLAKFFDDDIRFIRKCGLTTKELAEKYSVNRSTIQRIRSGRSWEHLP
jgi:DNA-binding transcriptional regulator YiaG